MPPSAATGWPRRRTTGWIADYYRLAARSAETYLMELAEEGLAEPVTIEGVRGRDRGETLRVLRGGIQRATGHARAFRVLTRHRRAGTGC